MKYTLCGTGPRPDGTRGYYQVRRDGVPFATGETPYLALCQANANECYGAPRASWAFIVIDVTDRFGG